MLLPKGERRVPRALRLASRALVPAVAVAAALAACSGGGGGVAQPAPATSAAASGASSAQFSITIPPRGTGTSRVRRHFVSPDVATLLVAAIAGEAAAGPALSIDVSPSSGACTAAATGARTCDVRFALQPGVTSFDIGAYGTSGLGAANGAGLGARLSHAVVPVPASSAAVITLAVVLDADVASFTVTVAPGAFTPGVAGTATLAIAARDAAGDTIGLPGSYDAPVLLTASDGAISISPASLTAPGQSAVITYSGAPAARSSILISSATALAGSTTIQVVGTPAPGTTPSAFPTPTATPFSVQSPGPTASPSAAPSPGATPSPGPTPTPTPFVSGTPGTPSPTPAVSAIVIVH